jgi:hypothetical protein
MNLTLRALYPERESPGTHWREDWVGPRAGENAPEKTNISCPSRASNPASLHSFTTYVMGHAVTQLVEALWHKSEGRGFDFQWCHWNFLLRPHCSAGVDTVYKRNKYQECLQWFQQMHYFNITLVQCRSLKYIKYLKITFLHVSVT